MKNLCAWAAISECLGWYCLRDLCSFYDATNELLNAGPMKDKVRTTLSSPYTKKLACGNCRRSKLKCDRVKPCTSCNLRGLQDQCYQSSQVEGTDQDVSRVDQTHIGESLSSPSLAQVNATLQGQHKAVSSLLSLVNESKLLSSSEERTWQDDVAQSLPSPQDCNVLLNFCYQNVGISSLTHRLRC
jgi:hypothetical protein